jgi:hypothetical protein
MTVDDTVVQKLWKLTNELTAQLVFNRNATLELKQQLADLQVRESRAVPMLPCRKYQGLHVRMIQPMLILYMLHTAR